MDLTTNGMTTTGSWCDAGIANTIVIMDYRKKQLANAQLTIVRTRMLIGSALTERRGRTYERIRYARN